MMLVCNFCRTSAKNNLWNTRQRLVHCRNTRTRGAHRKNNFLMLSRRSNEQDNPLFVLGEKNSEEKLIQGREKKLQAPETLHPKSTLTSRAAGEEAFLDMRHRY